MFILHWNLINKIEISPSSETPNSDIQDLKDTINDWINYQKQISSSNIIQTPTSTNPNNTNNSLIEPYKGKINVLYECFF